MVSEAKLEKDYITEKAVDIAHKMIEESNIEDQFRELPMQALTLLEAIYRLRDNKDVSTGEVYCSYEKACRDVGLESFTLRKVSDIITELESTGLISCRLISRGRSGRTRLISWPSNPTLDKIYERERQQRF
jgi:Cdc6-like AAA superfamily ATPase